MAEPIMKVTEAKLTDFIPDQNNANKGTQRGHKMIQDSLREDGLARSIVIDADNNVVAGNKTLENAVDIGLDKAIIVETTGKELVVTKRVDWNLYEDESPRRYAWRDNQSALASIEFDPEQLAKEIAQGIDFGGVFTEEEQKSILDGLVKEPPEEPGPPQIGRAEELRQEWGTELGQLWALGEHRLAVGDCTDRGVVEKVMGEERADMMFTDPPYGVGYTGGHFHSGDVNIKRERPKLINDQNTGIYARFLPVIVPFVDGPCYVWFADRGGKPVYNAIIDNGCEIHAMIIWNKINATYAAINAQYKQRHEPCMYFKPKGSTLRWCGPTDECTIWDEKRDPQNEYHPTQKPIVLPLRALKNHKANLISDPFLGSGTTLIAAHQLNRRCFGIEISPAYAAVTLQRFLDHTGIKPELIT